MKMAISALEALKKYRYTYFGFQSHPTDKNPWQATPVMAVSNNLVQWEMVTAFYQLEGLRDGYLKKIGDWYYIIGTGGFYKTNDFIQFEPLDYLKKGNFKDLWAPEIFQDNDGKYHIVYCAGDSSKGILDVYLADFDPATDTITSQDQEVYFYTDDIDNTYRIDPDITVINGIYYLTIGGNYVFSSNDYIGPYQKFPVNFAPTPQKYGPHDSLIDGWVEGPNMFVDGDSVRLFADQTDGNGLVFRSSTIYDMFDWARLEKTHANFKMRHGSIVVNEDVTAQVPAKVTDALKFDDRMTIQGLHAKQAVALTCFIKSSFQYQYENNQTNEIQFVAYDDGSPSFAYIANESLITFNDDLFVIKNVEEDDEGSELYTVTAMQYVNSEIGRVMQRNVRSGVLTYTVDSVLDFFLNDKTANPFGFTYHVYGNFDKQQIENLGACSGKDMINKIIETWPGTIIYPNKKTVGVYAADAFKKNYGRRLVYKYHSSDMKLTEDSTGIINQVRCIGATKEDDSNKSNNQNGNGNNGGNSGGQVTRPASGTPGACLDNAEAFAKSPINSDFGVNKQAMLQNFAARSQRVHAWGVDVNRLYDVIKQNGVSPEWFMAYELQEQGYGWGWLNHTYKHGDAYQDAASVCQWIKATSQSNSIRPAWSAPEGAMAPNPGLAARWNQEFGKGSIGRVYLQGTAAATWDLAGVTPNPRIGKPITGCVAVIKSWGGHNYIPAQKAPAAPASGWGWPFPNIPRNGTPGVFVNGQQYGHTGWIRPGSNTDFHDGFDFDASRYNGNCLAVHPGTVHKIGADLGWWYIWVQSPDGYNIVYQEGFTNPANIYVHEGQQVNVGTPIGRVTGTHTHIGISKQNIPLAYYHGFQDDGTWLNPIEVIKAGIAATPSAAMVLAAVPQQQTQTKTVTEDHSAEFQADAKKYLGVPYVWGGHNKGNPWAGMDCSGYVSQVYHDYGIEIPAYTIAMEHNFREIPYSEVRAGDVAFFGPHGGTHHIELMLDHNTAIYEPQPGQSCMMQPISQYPGTWYGRNDAMQAKIFPTKTVTTPITVKQDTSSSSTGTDTTETYYFEPFILQDDHSIELWGLHPGPDVQDDRFKDPESMKKYAVKQLVPDPVISVEVVMNTNVLPVPGEEAYLTIPERGSLIRESASATQNAYNTTVTVVGFTFYPFDPSQGTDITYDNLQASILHSSSLNSNLKRMEELANEMFDRMPQIFYTKKDPSGHQALKKGAMWANPYILSELTEKGGEKNDGKHGSGTTGDKSTGKETHSKNAH